MAAQGSITVDFGAGDVDKLVSVTGQTGITGSSLAEAWVFPVATATNTADDTAYDDIRVVAYNVTAGVGFDILVKSGTGLLHGQHTIGWVWN